ncbi:hypothetical protein ACIBCB_25820 [Streptomyces uncialis]|uniref:hypothetical protein n=1 Tax=Streptomyces uncialis TaxID=1048205 RepID=UPI0037A42A56
MTAPHQREGRAGRDLRLLRAAVFAAVCVVLSAAGHVLASYESVPLWSVTAGFLVVFAVAVPLAGRARSLPGIAALLAAGQLTLHTLFGIGQHGPAVPGAPSDASLIAQAAQLMCGAGAVAIGPAQAQRILTDARVLPGDGAGGGVVPHHFDPASPVASGSGSVADLLPTLPMLLAHVLSAALVGWLLRRGDLALIRLVRLSAQGVAEAALVRALRSALAFVRCLFAESGGAPSTGPRPVPADRSEPPVPRTEALQHSVIRRGPPSPVAAHALCA